ncbi:MAG: glycosyltransferase family 4 protein [Deltaproteobacteria bacterium]|nr:glycosyltransferase family 4 protein [Deltaproteobacteria bacterium]
MKILFIPEPGKTETSERSYPLIKILEKRHELLFLKPPGNPTQKRPSWPMRVFQRLQNIKQLIEEGKKFKEADLVLCRDYMHALPGSRIAKHLGIPCIWDSERSMKLFWEDHHQYPVQTLPWITVEKWLTKRVDHLVTVTERNKQAHILQGMDPNHIDIIPVCVCFDRRSRKSKAEARKALQLSADKKLFLFFSNFDYPPNQRALTFLNEKVAPRLPGELLLCGKGKLPKNLHGNIKYMGFLPLEKLYDLIRACDIGLSPVWEANGTLTKVLDMLAHGTATVVTDIVQTGIPELQDNVHSCIAKNEEEFIQKTLTLANDLLLQEKLRENGPHIIRSKYDWALYEDKLLDIVGRFERKNEKALGHTGCL